MKKHFQLYYWFILVFSLNSYSQRNKIDSLLTLLKTDMADTNKLNHLNKLAGEHVGVGNYDSSMYYANSSLTLATILDKVSTDPKIKQTIKKTEAVSLNTIGAVYYYQGNYPEAVKNYGTCLKIREEIGDKKNIAISFGNIGLVLDAQGNYPEALKNYFLSLKIREKLNDSYGIADSYNNIGLIYMHQGNYPEALKHYFSSLKIKEKIDDKKGMAATYNNIGSVYSDQGNYSEALKNHFAALKIRQSINDRKGIAYSYNNIGTVYYSLGNYQEALINYMASLKIKKAIGNKAGIASSYTNIGGVFTKQKKYKEAEEYLNKAKELSKMIGYKEYLREIYSSLTELDSSRENYKGAYENHKLYVLYSDSIDNEETKKKTIQSQMTYDFEKKEAATKAEQDKKDAVALADNKRQQLFLSFLAALAMAIGVIAIVIFRGLQQSKKAKKVIELQRDEISQQKETVEHQKLLVEEHQKEIVDSITYAKRIQYTLLANKQLLDTNLPKHFVLFKPKDIVSGDFYWATKRDNKFYIAACDSTGHGVPGAFMSLLNISFLNEAVNEKNIFEPNAILNHVRKRLIENMDGGQDGMDAILVCIEGDKITYAAANNSPAIIKNGTLISLEADKMPVGKGENLAPFSLRNIDVEKGDCLYLYTDGYADQFGGPKGKKFKYKQLDELLVSISILSPVEQSEMLNQRFEEWKGNLEQVDDMLVIGIKISS